MTVARSGHWEAALCLRCQDILREITNFIYLMKAEQTVYQLKEILVVKVTIYGLKKHSQETERDN